jgi:photosystem II stability/assembly factor-like uncharacterized protein
MKKHLSFVLLFLLTITFVQVNTTAQIVVQNSGLTTQRLVAVKPINEKTVWVGGMGGAVLKTLDGGATWYSKPYPGTTDSIRINSIAAFDSLTAWACTFNGVTATGCSIYKTTDGGNNWSLKYDLQNDSFGDFVYFWDSKNGVAVGDPTSDRPSYWLILTTSDGGDTWNRVDSAKIPAADGAKLEGSLSNGFSVVGNTIWFGAQSNNSVAGYVPRVFYSKDKGLTWANSSPITDLTSVQGVGFIDANNGFAASTDGKSASTSDGGQTWSLVTPVGFASIRAFDYRPGNYDLLAVGSGGKIYNSIDNGYSWTSVTDPNANNLRGIGFLPNSNISWIVGDNGTILKWDENATAVNDKGAIPGKYGLQQNFPNPFNPTTTIRYSVPKESKVSLSVYDALGRQVATLVNDVKSAGEHQATFNASNLSSGVYFYRLKADGFTDFKKLVLMK